MRAMVWLGLLLAAAAAISGCSGSSSAQGTGSEEIPGVEAIFFAPLNGTEVIFIGFTPETGAEPWITDGTEAGTFALDILAGASSSMSNPDLPGNHRAFLIDGNMAYFLADDGISGRELWRTDGTLSGTSLVADVVPGPEGLQSQRDMIIHNGKVFLTGRHEVTDENILFVLDLD